MSIAENRQTFEDFIPGLKDSKESVRTEHIISVFKETHRLTDNWPYYIDQGGIFFETADEKIYVKDIVASAGEPEHSEAEVLKSLETWAGENEDGVSVWISPPYPGKYPCSKIILHQIAYEYGTLRKTVLSTAILFDSPDDKTLSFLKENFPETVNTLNLEDLRSRLLTPGVSLNLDKLIAGIKALDANTLPTENTMTNEELIRRVTYISGLIGNGVNSRFVAYEMQRLKLLGQFSISCPAPILDKLTGFSEIISQGMELREEGWHSGICRICRQSTWVGGCDICASCVELHFS